jgi:hypothetical protein
VGYHPPIPDNGSLYCHFRKISQFALGRNGTLRDYGLCWHAALALAEAANSVIGSANLMAAFVDFLISFVILVGLMIWYRAGLSPAAMEKRASVAVSGCPWARRWAYQVATA